MSVGFRTRDLFVAYDKLSKQSDHVSLYKDDDGVLSFVEEDGHQEHSVFWRQHAFSERFSLNHAYLDKMTRATLGSDELG